MWRQVLIILFLCVISFNYSLAQPPNYRKADSIALSLSGKRITDAELLVKQLTQELTSDTEKTRAIFRWITANIRYNSKEADKIIKNNFEPTKKRFKSETEAIRWREKRYYKKVTSALRKRKAVCEGYAMLFKHLCSWANIHAEVVTGHYRDHTLKIGKYYKPTHAWNAVKLDGKWYMLDATMAAGHVEPITGKFIKNFSGNYFLPLPEQMLTTHYPTDNQWLLIANVPTIKSFYKRPVSMDGYFTQRLITVFPEEGIIRAEPDETITIHFKTSDSYDISSLYCLIESDNKKIERRFLPSKLIRVSENEYKAEICFPKKGNFRFYVLLNKEPALLYQAVIRTAPKTKK